MNIETARYNFLRVVGDAVKKAPLLSVAGGLRDPGVGENPMNVDWVATRNESVVESFRLADMPSQRFQYLFTADNDTRVYGLSISAGIAPSVLNPEINLFITDKPVAELYTQSVSPENAGYIENQEGMLIATSLDPRIVTDAIRKFYTTHIIDMFLYVIAAVPIGDIGSETQPGDLRYEDIKPETPKLITYAPFALLPPDASQDSIALRTSATGVNSLFPDAIRLTGRDGSVGFYIGKPRFQDQMS